MKKEIARSKLVNSIRSNFENDKIDKESNHTFLILKDKTIVDITADQFGGPKVYIGKMKFPWST